MDPDRLVRLDQLHLIAEHAPGKDAATRWVTRGIFGGTIRLTAERHGRHWMTRRSWYQTFVNERTAAELAHRGASPSRQRPDPGPSSDAILAAAGM